MTRLLTVIIGHVLSMLGGEGGRIRCCEGAGEVDCSTGIGGDWKKSLLQSLTIGQAEAATDRIVFVLKKRRLEKI